VDIGFANVVSLSIAHERGVPFTLLASANLHMPTQVTAGILTVLKSGPIKSAKDLEGKVVAVNGLNNISSVSVQAWVDKNGGDWKTVKFVEMPFPQMPDAVRAGRVDAASIDAANEQLLVKPDTDLRRLANVFDAVGTHFAPSSWFTSAAWVDAHPAAAKAFIAVMAEAGECQPCGVGGHPREVPQQNAAGHRLGHARAVRHEDHAGLGSALDRRRR
jgi:NitT/TauT family transport system substrate-binding protein